MTKQELIAIALENARSHLPTAILTDQLQHDLDWLIRNSGQGKTDFRDWVCQLTELLTDKILSCNKYSGRIRTFCNRGLLCDCRIPCG